MKAKHRAAVVTIAATAITAALIAGPLSPPAGPVQETNPSLADLETDINAVDARVSAVNSNVNSVRSSVSTLVNNTTPEPGSADLFGSPYQNAPNPEPEQTNRGPFAYLEIFEIPGDVRTSQFLGQIGVIAMDMQWLSIAGRDLPRSMNLTINRDRSFAPLLDAAITNRPIAEATLSLVGTDAEGLVRVEYTFLFEQLSIGEIRLMGRGEAVELEFSYSRVLVSDEINNFEVDYRPQF